ncbi:MAG: DMT family transporter [Polyangiales bacterium]|nr:DMT family transporter [Myxococcales bacterium]
MPAGVAGGGRVAVATTFALLCFAGNSLLCRLALVDGSIDPISFTAVRIGSGALCLAALTRGRGFRSGTNLSAVALFAYAAAFSYAYVRLPAGIGALVLFACVQFTMIGVGVLRGERLPPRGWFGVVIALVAFGALTFRSADLPDRVATLLMAVAGVAWGIYSLRGRAAGVDPLAATASNFLRATPLTLVLWWAPGVGHAQASPTGLALAAASGVITSGIGYSLWYAALPSLSASLAGVLQLIVPVLAALAGVAFLSEPLTLRLVLAGTAVLGGVALVIAARAQAHGLRLARPQRSDNPLA